MPAIASAILMLASLAFGGLGVWAAFTVVSDIQLILSVVGIGFGCVLFGLAVLVGNIPLRG